MKTVISLTLNLIAGVVLFLIPAILDAQTDGPATLPKFVPATSFISANPVTVVPIAGLQAALTGAKCGDFFNVLPGDWVGALKLPKGCDAGNAVTVNAQPGARILLCGSQSVNGGAFAVLNAFEVTRASTCLGVTYNMIAPGAGAHDLIFSNLNVHGDATHETVRGLALYGSYNIAVLNSTFSDFHCLSVSGACGDSQAIAFGVNDTSQSGNYLIDRNHLEAAGENILGGGGADNYTPCDITITNNTLTKPTSWMPGSSDYAGYAWIVKNLFELKNGCRVLAENNVFSRTFGGYTQNGSGILITPKNQNGQCAACSVTDVTFRKNRVEYTGTPLQLACALSDSGAPPRACGNWSINHNEFLHQQYFGCYQCSGLYLIQLGSSLSPIIPVLSGVLIDHNLFQVDGWYGKYHGFLMVGGPVGSQQQQNINFTNNIVPQGYFPMYYSGGTANCGYNVIFQSYSKTIQNCWGGQSSFTGNTILTTGETGSGTAPASTWPAGNFLIDAGANPNTLPQ